jgi:hypothetical protein
LNLRIGVSTVEDAGEIEQFGALVDLCPEPLFELLFGVALCGEFFDEVEVSKNTDDFGKAVGLQYIEKLERFL